MTKTSNFEKVGDFMEAFGQRVEMEPTWPDFNTRELRLELIQEELEAIILEVEEEEKELNFESLDFESRDDYFD